MWNGGVGVGVQRGLLALVSTLLLVFLIVWHFKRRRMVKLIERLPGPPALPILGNALDVNIDIMDLFPLGMLVVREYGPIMRAWLGTAPLVIISGAKQAETVLCSVRYLDKPHEYSFFHPWLGSTGLFVADGPLWHHRRRLLTPAFHLKILEQYVEVFTLQTSKMAEKLHHHVGGEVFPIFPYITNCTLDAICETIMGTSVNAQDNPDSEYVEAVQQIQGLIQQRMLNFWQHPDFMFRLLGYERKQTQLLATLHSFTRDIIARRRELYLAQRNHTQEGKRPRLAFLDLLLEYSEDGRVLSEQDIREEVDLFVFAGHDTTAAAINWTLYLLGDNPDIQELVYEELEGIFGDSTRAANVEDLREMRCLERCIKEAMRLYPSAPYIGRVPLEDVVIDGYTIPAGTKLMLLSYALHRDPSQFPDPEKFDPDRFLSENISQRHPFSYIPFSAGPRSCLGQKFGMMEMKVMLSHFLRQYRIESVVPKEEIKVRSEIVLRPNDGTLVRLYHRRGSCGGGDNMNSECKPSEGVENSTVGKGDYYEIRKR
ncbi:hypothetical protein Pmani_003250 [Petrolisthes manimaculis]|uniref:Cytochrome P450 n=1 Tax=Petrolisthes manimaculis TaxID=1843537 RepID=A0AAE1QGZ0_9EUCA|nr:hypothetical protein Pmani_003250 [Petrolisthes manimaculis]